MKLIRNLAVGLMLSGLALAGTPAAAEHHHGPRCGHRHYARSHHYDRGYYGHRYYAPAPVYGYGYGYPAYGPYYGQGYGYGYPAPYASYHYHGGRRCSRSHVSVYLGF